MIPNGLRVLAAIRSGGRKPGFVHVHLTREHCRWADAFALTDAGDVSVHVPDEVRLTDLDWRPLRGLGVHLWQFGRGHADVMRLRKVARQIAAVEPQVLRVFVPEGDDDVTMQRYEGGKWLPGVRL